MLPFITIMAGVLAELFGGAAITEADIQLARTWAVVS
jgi:hypothetical protein